MPQCGSALCRDGWIGEVYDRLGRPSLVPCQVCRPETAARLQERRRQHREELAAVAERPQPVHPEVQHAE